MPTLGAFPRNGAHHPAGGEVILSRVSDFGPGRCGYAANVLAFAHVAFETVGAEGGAGFRPVRSYRSIAAFRGGAYVRVQGAQVDVG